MAGLFDLPDRQAPPDPEQEAAAADYQDRQQELEEAFIELYSDMTIPFHTILKEIDHVFNFSIGTGMQLFKSLIKSRKITLDLTRKINLQDPRVLPYLKV